MADCLWFSQKVCFSGIERCAGVPHRRRRPGCGGSCVNYHTGWDIFFSSDTGCSAKKAHIMCVLLQVFDATNTTRERRETILEFAEQNGFKVTWWAQSEGSGFAGGHTDSVFCLPSGVLCGVCVWRPRCHTGEHSGECLCLLALFWLVRRCRAHSSAVALL